MKKSIRISWWKHVAFWVMYWFVQSILMDENNELGFYLAKNFSMVLLQVIIVYFNLFVLIPYIYQRGRKLLYLLAVLVLIYLAYSASFHCIQYTIAKVHSVFPSILILKFPESILSFHFDFWQVFSDSVPYSLALVCSCVYYLNQTNHIAEREKSQLEIEKNKAELKFLRSQISPHFLFNSLNNLHYLIGKDRQRSEQYTLKLSEVLRYIVYSAKEEEVPLVDEIKHIESYIDLMKLSIESSEKISYINSISKSELRISPLLLLTIIENGFKHSGIRYDNSATLSIQLTLRHHKMALKMRNTISPNTSVQENKSTSLQNLRTRLKLSYPDRHAFVFNIDDHEAFTSLTIDLD